MVDISALNLPNSVQSKIQFYPFEDMLEKIFARGLPDLRFRTFVEEQLQYPLVVGVRSNDSGGWSGDPRFIDSGPVKINVLTEGINGELEGQFIAEAIRVVMMQASQERWHFPGTGSILKIRLLTAPEDTPDWESATGVVQFADLPKNVTRFETNYQMVLRRPM